MLVPLSFFDDNWRPDPAGLNFHGTLPVETAGTGGIIASACLRWCAMWGNGTFRAAALDASMAGVSDTGWTKLSPGAGKDYWWVPDKARSIYVEGRRDTATTAVGVTVLPIAK